HPSSTIRIAKTCWCFAFVKRCHHCFCKPGTKQTNHSAAGTFTGEPFESISTVRSSGTPAAPARPASFSTVVSLYRCHGRTGRPRSGHTRYWRPGWLQGRAKRCWLYPEWLAAVRGNDSPADEGRRNRAHPQLARSAGNRPGAASGAPDPPHGSHVPDLFVGWIR